MNWKDRVSARMADPCNARQIAVCWRGGGMRSDPEHWGRILLQGKFAGSVLVKTNGDDPPDYEPLFDPHGAPFGIPDSVLRLGIYAGMKTACLAKYDVIDAWADSLEAPASMGTQGGTHAKAE